MPRSSLTPSFSLARQLALALGVILGVGALAQSGVLDGPERLARDWRMQQRGPQKPRTKIVIVEIDSATLTDPKFSQPLLFWGPHHARVLQILREGGAKAVGFDLVQAVSLGHLAQSDPDQSWALEISQMPNLVLNYTRTPLSDGLSRDVMPNDLLRTALALGGGRLGFANTTPDDDGVVRGFAPFDRLQGGEKNESFALALAAVASGKTPRENGRKLQIGARELTLDSQGRALIDYIGPDGAFERVSYQHLLANPAKYRGLLNGSVALVGMTSYEMQDYHSIPLWRQNAGRQGNLMAGVETQAAILHTLLAGRDLRASAPIWSWVLLFGASLGAVPAAWRPRTSLILPLLGAILLGWLGVCLGAFVWGGLYLPLVATALAFVLSFGAQTGARLWQESGRKRWMETVMGRYVSPEVVELLRRSPEALELGGKRREITVLFSDVRGFTSLSEQLEPEQVTQFLNLYLETMVEIIFAHGGTVDKFMGDGIMVIWNWPLETPDHARRAVDCAVAMQNAVVQNRANWQKLGMPPIEIGVGLHTGAAIVGNVGSKRRMEQTAIGDTVNVASRIEGLCKTVGKSCESGILLSETTFQQAFPGGETESEMDIAAAGETPVRGRAQPMRLFAVRLTNRAQNSPILSSNSQHCLTPISRKRETSSP